MMTLIKRFRYSYLHLVCTLILFSNSFFSYENGLYITLLFFLLINFTCFSNEYLVIRYYDQNKQKDRNKGYALFIVLQVFITLIIFFGFKFAFSL